MGRRAVWYGGENGPNRTRGCSPLALFGPCIESESVAVCWDYGRIRPLSADPAEGPGPRLLVQSLRDDGVLQENLERHYLQRGLVRGFQDDRARGTGALDL